MAGPARRIAALLGLGALVAVAALTALPGRSAADSRSVESCDYSGFGEPCKVPGGSYRVLIPKGKGPFPVLMYLYGSGGHSSAIADHPIFQQTIVARGYALLVPEAKDLVYAGNIRDTGWALHSDANPVRDEPAFLRRVLNNAARRFPIDRHRVLIAGQSRGAFLTWELACTHPDLAAAFALHAGGYLEPRPDHCVRPVRLLVSQGLNDAVVPIDGAATGFGAPLPSLGDELDWMARSNHCPASDAPKDEAFYQFARRSWQGCAKGGSLDLLLGPGGHPMPLIWFRAALDWFEEAPAAAGSGEPAVRVLGDNRPSGMVKVGEGRSNGRFKTVPSDGTAKRVAAPSQ